MPRGDPLSKEPILLVIGTNELYCRRLASTSYIPVLINNMPTQAQPLQSDFAQLKSVLLLKKKKNTHKKASRKTILTIHFVKCLSRHRNVYHC